MSWQNAPTLTKLSASQQGGNRGAQLWGVQNNGTLNTIYQVTPGGGWSQWTGPSWNGQPGGPKQSYELAAAQQNDGRVQFFALDMMLQLWSTWQTSPGGNWSAWSGPNWNNAPQGMKKIAASQQGGNRGAQLWGIQDDYTLVTCYQLTPGGNWSGWQGWPATPDNSQFVEVTAAQQNDGRVQCGRSTRSSSSGLATRLRRAAIGATGRHRTGTARRRHQHRRVPAGRLARRAALGIKEDGTLVTDYQVSPAAVGAAGRATVSSASRRSTS